MLPKFVRYGLVGVIVTGTYIVTFLLLSGAFPSARTGNSITAYLLACLIQYVGNAWFTFERPIRSRRQVARYLVSIAAGLALTSLIVLVLGPAVGMPDFLAALLASALVTVLNFLIMLTWTFAVQQPVHKGNGSQLTSTRDAS